MCEFARPKSSFFLRRETIRRGLFLGCHPCCSHLGSRCGRATISRQRNGKTPANECFLAGFEQRRLRGGPSRWCRPGHWQEEKVAWQEPRRISCTEPSPPGVSTTTPTLRLRPRVGQSRDASHLSSWALVSPPTHQPRTPHHSPRLIGSH